MAAIGKLCETRPTIAHYSAYLRVIFHVSFTSRKLIFIIIMVTIIMVVCTNSECMHTCTYICSFSHIHEGSFQNNDVYVRT